MLESLRCPSCSTHYGLGPQRVRIGIRRAKCFRCGHFFDIQATVERLLPPPEAPAPESLFDELPGFAAGDLAGIEFQEDIFQEEPAPKVEDVEAPASLTLGDLDVTEGSMDTTLVDFTPPAPTDSRYASAKDAISRLLGDAPPPSSASHPFPTSRSSNPMDVEATLEALENTLGGVQPSELERKAPEADLGSTVRMNLQDLKAALSEEVDPAAQTLSMPLPQFPAPLKATPASAPVLPPPQPAPLTVPTAQDPNLLKLKIGEDLYENLSVDQISTWIEQGRVLESHQVARQFSENWIEAIKVPTLRPVFDRIKRLRSVLPDETPGAAPAPAPEPAKKSLFGGLFGRN
ncbi:hypothetical protein [Holophaga foetida]|uniref:hypothetical protein n=1 Tax=Holophaga foetida TaxID=35839 RepID=UPI0002472F23|nr:hypothetical protein [Holophaga foetida]